MLPSGCPGAGSAEHVRVGDGVGNGGRDRGMQIESQIKGAARQPPEASLHVGWWRHSEEVPACFVDTGARMAR